jgi:hypothetical protein
VIRVTHVAPAVAHSHSRWHKPMHTQANLSTEPQWSARDWAWDGYGLLARRLDPGSAGLAQQGDGRPTPQQQYGLTDAAAVLQVMSGLLATQQQPPAASRKVAPPSGLPMQPSAKKPAFRPLCQVEERHTRFSGKEIGNGHALGKSVLTRVCLVVAQRLSCCNPHMSMVTLTFPSYFLIHSLIRSSPLQ